MSPDKLPGPLRRALAKAKGALPERAAEAPSRKGPEMDRRDFIRTLAVGAGSVGALAFGAAYLGRTETAWARTGSMKVTAMTNSAGFLGFKTSNGTYAYCVSPGKDGPVGLTFKEWDWIGEARGWGYNVNVHSLAYFLHKVGPSYSPGFSTPHAAVAVGCWVLCGTEVDWSSGVYKKKNAAGKVVMTGNIYSGAGARLSRSDGSKLKALVEESKKVTTAGAWDRSGRLWYSNADWAQSVVELYPDPITIKIRVVKKSANPEITANNTRYTLNGAVYGVYSNEACTKQVDTLTLKGDHNSAEATSKSLTAGTYWVKETKAAVGYQLDQTKHKVNASSTVNATFTCNVTDVPNGGSMEFLKKDGS